MVVQAPGASPGSTLKIRIDGKACQLRKVLMAKEKEKEVRKEMEKERKAKEKVTKEKAKVKAAREERAEKEIGAVAGQDPRERAEEIGPTQEDEAHQNIPRIEDDRQDPKGDDLTQDHGDLQSTRVQQIKYAT